MRITIKSVLSVFILIVFAIIGAGSNESITTRWWIIAVFVILIIVAIILTTRQEEKAKIERNKRKENRLERQQQEEAELLAMYRSQKQSFLLENGIPDKSIILKTNEIDSEIHVYESNKTIFIMGKRYQFKDILSCTIDDNPRTIKGKITALKKTDNRNVIGRSIVGGAIGGSTGAVIGGATARQNMEFVQEDDKFIHDYSIIISVNSISNPIIRIHTEEDAGLTNEIVGLMNVIISRNQQH